MFSYNDVNLFEKNVLRKHSIGRVNINLALKKSCLSMVIKYMYVTPLTPTLAEGKRETSFPDVSNMQFMIPDDQKIKLQPLCI